MSNGGGSVRISGGSITVEFDKQFKEENGPSGKYKWRDPDKKITEIVVTDESGDTAYMKFDAGLLPPGQIFFIKVNYEVAVKSATAGMS